MFPWLANLFASPSLLWWVGLAGAAGALVMPYARFAGAARELSQALIVNPYHVEETADASVFLVQFKTTLTADKLVEDPAINAGDQLKAFFQLALSRRPR